MGYLKPTQAVDSCQELQSLHSALPFVCRMQYRVWTEVPMVFRWDPQHPQEQAALARQFPLQQLIPLLAAKGSMAGSWGTGAIAP